MSKENVHPNSLKNLRKPKRYKKGHGYRYSIPQEKIDELYKLLADGVYLKQAAKKVDICYNTAKKYYEKGDQRRGIKPLKFRLIKFQDKVSHEFEEEMIDRRVEFLKITEKAIKKLEEQLDSGVLLKKSSLSQLAKFIRLEVFLRGGTEVHEQQLLSAEEIRSIATGTEEESSRI